MSDMAILIAEIKVIREKIKALEARPSGGDAEKIKILEEKIAGLEKKLQPLEDSDFDTWDQ